MNLEFKGQSKVSRYDLVWQPYLSILPISFGCSRRGEGLKKQQLVCYPDVTTEKPMLACNAFKEVANQ
ncbi:hypothetical protein OUZ56_021613 [Daphnia magna]|uniref:Uncharacterized protein n=1 Tax=Daphnia magna TaxID=35525 RepID=A0ABR0AU15_9CRUS|nr:hypothetical protein OUZ56_021613 [Daphnia magna]